MIVLERLQIENNDQRSNDNKIKNSVSTFIGWLLHYKMYFLKLYSQLILLRTFLLCRESFTPSCPFDGQTCTSSVSPSSASMLDTTDPYVMSPLSLKSSSRTAPTPSPPSSPPSPRSSFPLGWWTGLAWLEVMEVAWSSSTSLQGATDWPTSYFRSSFSKDKIKIFNNNVEVFLKYEHTCYSWS